MSYVAVMMLNFRARDNYTKIVQIFCQIMKFDNFGICSNRILWGDGDLQANFLIMLPCVSLLADLREVAGISCYKCDDCPDPWNSKADNVVRRDCPQSDSLCIVSNMVILYEKCIVFRASFSIWLVPTESGKSNKSLIISVSVLNKSYVNCDGPCKSHQIKKHHTGC